MLKTRLITALLLVPLVFWGVLGLSNPWFAAVLGVIMLGGVWELTNLCGLKTPLSRLLPMLFIAVALPFLYTQIHSVWVTWLVQALAVWWVLVLLVLLSGQLTLKRKDAFRPLMLGTGMLVLCGVWLALVRLHGLDVHGPKLMMFFLLLIWVADSGACFSGKAFGKRKLAPHISPGKSIEGVVGALLGGAFCALILGYLGWLNISTPLLVMLCVSTVLISVSGDLWESVLKRERGVKDSGNILPGHGGVLDRIDSQIAAGPFFVTGLMLFGAVT